MNKTLVRLISALVALGIFFFLFFQFQEEGVKAFILAFALIAQWEYAELTFLKTDRKYQIPLLFLFIALSQLVTQSFLEFQPDLLLGAGSAMLAISMTLLLLRGNSKPDLNLSLFNTMSFVLGLFYVGALPGMIVGLVDIDNGFYWLITLMSMVFLGDTAAYFLGLTFGKKKILPNISPKKTIVGSVGGLFGSIIGGVVCYYLFFEGSHQLHLFVVVSLFAGCLGQSGDFFESLIKRVADVKDSGRIMPGHGGALDRIDGLLFAAPALLWLTLISS